MDLTIRGGNFLFEVTPMYRKLRFLEHIAHFRIVDLNPLASFVRLVLIEQGTDTF